MKKIFFNPKLRALRQKEWIILGAIYLLLLLSQAKAGSTSVLSSTVILNTGGKKVEVPQGTAVSILKTGDSICVVSMELPDGTPIITQISSKLLSASETAVERHRLFSPVVPEAEVNSDSPSETAFAKGADIKVAQSPASSSDGPIYPQFKIPSGSTNSVLPGIRYEVQTGTFQLPINNGMASVVYAIPMEGNKPAESASNLVFYGPYPNEKTKLNANIIPSIVKNLGCTVFSFQIEGIGQAVSDKPYWLKEAGWFDAALRARDVLRKKLSLQARKLILVGYSGGGAMVLDFAGAYPNEIEAVAAQAPDVVPIYPAGNKIKWLLVVNRGDSNRAVMMPFYNRLQSEKCQALFCETTPDRTRGHYHSPSDETFNLIYCFIAGILDQRRLSDEGVTDIAHLWPYVAPSSPLQRYAIVKTSELQHRGCSKWTI